MLQLSEEELTAIITEKVDRLFPRLVEIRRHFHMYPEVSMKEFNTTKRINELLGEFSISRIPLSIDNGTAAEVIGNGSGPVVAVRADIDALPIYE